MKPLNPLADSYLGTRADFPSGVMDQMVKCADKDPTWEVELSHWDWGNPALLSLSLLQRTDQQNHRKLMEEKKNVKKCLSKHVKFLRLHQHFRALQNA